MISANELRIGNWVSFKGLWNGRVREVSASGVILIEGNDGFFDDENIQPIPIDRDMLTKLGAELFGDGVSLTLNNRLINYAECRNEYYDNATSVTLKHVHQYQNFIFALTSQELTIKL